MSKQLFRQHKSNDLKNPTIPGAMMNRFIKISFLLVLMLSCTKDKTEPGYPQKWQLVKMIGNYTSVFTGDEMSWQEYYLLQADSTFKKHRIHDGVISEASGTWSKIRMYGDDFFELVYEHTGGIVASCHTDREHLQILNSRSASSTWTQCDGPGLIYNLVKK
jgi:hypothetical protein